MSRFDTLLPRRQLRDTAEYTLDGIYLGSDKSAVLIGKHAGRNNKAYTSALLKVVNERNAGFGGRQSVARLDANDAQHLKLMAKYVIVGWKNVVEADGKPTPYNADLCLELLTRLLEPDQLGPEIVGANGAIDRYFSDADHFRDEPIGDVEELGKR